MFNKTFRKKTKLLIGSLLLLNILSGVFGASAVFAEAKQSTLTLSASTNSLSVELTPDASGTFGKSNAATIRVRTDNFTGYTLSIYTDGNTDLVGSTGGTIPSITESVTEQAFSADSKYNNKWGYRPSKIAGGDNTSFLPAPGALGDTIDVTSTYNTTDNLYTLDFGVRANYNTIPGTYSNSLTIIALANSITYNINYDENTTDTVSDMPSPNPQVVTIDGGVPVAQSVATLSSATPTRSGYSFEGWCDVATTLDANTGNQTCSGNTYAAGADYGIDQTEDGSNITLYAVWNTAEYELYLEDTCPYAHTSHQIWSSISYGATTLGNVGISTCPDIDDPEDRRVISDFNTSHNNAGGATVSFQSTGNCTDASSCASSKTASFTFAGWYTSVTAEGWPSGSLVASAASTPVLQTNVSGYTDSSGRWIRNSNTALYGGWTKHSDGIYKQVTLPTITKSGYVCKWQNVNNTSVFYDSGASIVPTSSLAVQGYCELTMQGATQADLNTLLPNVGDTTTLVDNRDSREYIVGKAADGNYWMLQNLKLGKDTNSVTLTSSNTDVSSSFTLDNKLSDGKFHSYTVDEVDGQNNNSEYYCTDDYGCYYNWYTATAGTGTTSTTSGDAADSICPAGWVLPSSSQFSTLYSQYPSAAQMLVDDPTTTTENTTGKIPGFLLGGYYNTDGADILGSGGYYWSRSADSAQFTNDLYLSASIVLPADGSNKYSGFAVRCVRD